MYSRIISLFFLIKTRQIHKQDSAQFQTTFVVKKSGEQDEESAPDPCKKPHSILLSEEMLGQMTI